MAFEFVESVVAERKSNGIYRQHHTFDPVEAGVFVRYQGKEYLNFSSNDYLGLAVPAEQLLASLDEYKLTAFKDSLSGSTGSPLLTGHHSVHQYLEELLADITGYSAILLFSSGFAANQGSISALMNSDQCVQYHDKLNHASLVDAGLSSKGQMKRFAHNDLAHLQRRMLDPNTQEKPFNQLIVSEGVFSMDGDQADLPALTAVASQQDAWLYLDDAHGFGVLGEQGQGSINAQGSACDHVQIYMANFGKAVASYGAFIATSTPIAEFLRQHCRHYVYSTAISPIQALLTIVNLQRMRSDSWRREALKERIAQFSKLAVDYELPVMPSQTAIQPLLLGDSQRALNVSEQLKQAGFWVSAIRPPTVPVNQARLRISLSAAHSAEAVRKLVQAIRGALDSHDYE